MKSIKKSWRKLVLLTCAFLTPISILYADGETSTTVMINNPLATNNINTVPDFIQKILIGVIKIGMPVIALAIIYSGFLFVAARGNTEKLGEAKKSLTYTLIGAAILLGSWAIATLISNTVLSL